MRRTEGSALRASDCRGIGTAENCLPGGYQLKCFSFLPIQDPPTMPRYRREGFSWPN